MNATTTHILPDPPGSPPAARTLSVLVVDESAAQRVLISSVLRRMGLDVHGATCPERAFELIESEVGASIGMVISGWKLAGMDGPDFCRAFRARMGDRYTYFVLMTARSEPRAKTEGLDAGADDFVTRPVDMGELRARVRSGLRMLAMQEDLLHRNHEVATTLRDLQSIQDAMNRDLVEARRLQRAFLPAEDASYRGCALKMRLITQGPVGGDLLGHFEMNDGRIALYSIDVSGHGIASALLTGRLAGLFSTWRPHANVVSSHPDAMPDPPEAVLSRVNAMILDGLDTDIYFTCALAYLDCATGKLEFCQAGHPHPLLRRADGTVEALGEGGPPVGLLEGAAFERCEATMRPGDALLLYSDGLTECADSWGDMLGEEGLMELFAAADPKPDRIIDGIERGLRKHTGIAGFDDDVSMLAFTMDADA